MFNPKSNTINMPTSPNWRICLTRTARTDDQFSCLNQKTTEFSVGCQWFQSSNRNERKLSKNSKGKVWANALAVGKKPHKCLGQLDESFCFPCRYFRHQHFTTQPRILELLDAFGIIYCIYFFLLEIMNLCGVWHHMVVKIRENQQGPCGLSKTSGFAAQGGGALKTLRLSYQRAWVMGIN